MTPAEYKKWKDTPRHRYLVPIQGGICPYYEVIAPNKTVAREIARGEVNSWITVKGKIIDKGLIEEDW